MPSPACADRASGNLLADDPSGCQLLPPAEPNAAARTNPAIKIFLPLRKQSSID